MVLDPGVNKTGIIIIGRNEGERLIGCIKSVLADDHEIVYVDSSSTDDSVANARQLGVDVVELDMSLPFTAARARNAGFERLRQIDESITYVQFVDGDCSVDESWLAFARNVLDQQQDVAIVCGRRRERYPGNSVYNYLCDQEWNTPVGDALACGGDFMMRAEVFEKLNGFNGSLIAGEEPELCVRVRQARHRILRLDHEMTLHDADILHFRQWWRRSVRAGHAYAEGAWMHGGKPYHHKLKEVLRSWFWAGVLPVFIVITSITLSPLFLLLLGLYPMQIMRMALRQKGKVERSRAMAFFTMLGKFPELQGQLQFWKNHLSRSRTTLIEYK